MRGQYLDSVDAVRQCEINFSDKPRTSTFVNYIPAMEPRRLVPRAVIAGAGMLAIIIGVGGGGLRGQTPAGDPPCVASAADACLVNVPRPAPPPRRQPQTFCQPAGMAGQHCFQRWVP